jgi:hypothetical protein
MFVMDEDKLPPSVDDFSLSRIDLSSSVVVASFPF